MEETDSSQWKTCAAATSVNEKGRAGVGLASLVLTTLAASVWLAPAVPAAAALGQTHPAPPRVGGAYITATSPSSNFAAEAPLLKVPTLGVVRVAQLIAAVVTPHRIAARPDCRKQHHQMVGRTILFCGSTPSRPTIHTSYLLNVLATESSPSRRPKIPISKLPKNHLRRVTCGSDLYSGNTKQAPKKNPNPIATGLVNTTPSSSAIRKHAMTPTSIFNLKSLSRQMPRFCRLLSEVSRPRMTSTHPGPG